MPRRFFLQKLKRVFRLVRYWIKTVIKTTHLLFLNPALATNIYPLPQHHPLKISLRDRATENLRKTTREFAGHKNFPRLKSRRVFLHKLKRVFRLVRHWIKTVIKTTHHLRPVPGLAEISRALHQRLRTKHALRDRA